MRTCFPKLRERLVISIEYSWGYKWWHPNVTGTLRNQSVSKCVHIFGLSPGIRVCIFVFTWRALTLSCHCLFYYLYFNVLFYDLYVKIMVTTACLTFGLPPNRFLVQVPQSIRSPDHVSVTPFPSVQYETMTCQLYTRALEACEPPWKYYSQSTLRHSESIIAPRDRNSTSTKYFTVF